MERKILETLLENAAKRHKVVGMRYTSRGTFYAKFQFSTVAALYSLAVTTMFEPFVRVVFSPGEYTVKIFFK